MNVGKKAWKEGAEETWEEVIRKTARRETYAEKVYRKIMRFGRK